MELLSRSAGFANCIVGNVEKIVENRTLLSGGSMKLNRERASLNCVFRTLGRKANCDCFFWLVLLHTRHSTTSYLRGWSLNMVNAAIFKCGSRFRGAIERQCVEYEIEIATELKFPIEVIENIKTGRGLSVHDELLPEQRRMLGRSIRNLRTMPDQE